MNDERPTLPEQTKRRVFKLGETVRIIYGPFGSFMGKIEGINQGKSVLKIKVAIFGRDKPIKLNFGAVRKVSEP